MASSGLTPVNQKSRLVIRSRASPREACFCLVADILREFVLRERGCDVSFRTANRIGSIREDWLAARNGRSRLGLTSSPWIYSADAIGTALEVDVEGLCILDANVSDAALDKYLGEQPILPHSSDSCARGPRSGLVA